MKFRHNKKRNTAFLFEVLVRELTKASIKEDINKKNKILSLIKTNFGKGSQLSKELRLYKAITENKNINRSFAEKLILNVLREHEKLDKKKIFLEQSELIKEMNKTFSKNVFLNFVPGYKNLATIYQMFNAEVTPKKKVLLEEKTLDIMVGAPAHEDSKVPSDSLVYKNFIKNFNSTYSENLLNEQKELLNKYITSFSDNGLGLKIFLNEEVGRLKKFIKTHLESTKELNDDSSLKEKLEKMLFVFEDIRTQEINSPLVEKILKMQSLASELQQNND